MCRQIIPLMHIVFFRIREDGGLVEKMIISKLMMYRIVIKVNNFYLKMENTGMKAKLGPVIDNYQLLHNYYHNE